jgi:hypothetical protein
LEHAGGVSGRTNAGVVRYGRSEFQRLPDAGGALADRILASDKADYQLYVQSGDIFPSMFMNDDGEESVEDEKTDISGIWVPEGCTSDSSGSMRGLWVRLLLSAAS